MEALTQFENLLKEAPDSDAKGNLHNNIGFIFGEQNRFDDALKEFHLGLDHQPKNAALLGNLATLYHKMKKFIEAGIYYGKALEIEPKNVNFRYMYSYALAESRKFKESMEQLKQCIELEPTFYRAYGDLAMITVSRSHEEALKLVDTMISLLETAFQDNVEVNDQNGDVDDARKDVVVDNHNENDDDDDDDDDETDQNRKKKKKKWTKFKIAWSTTTAEALDRTNWLPSSEEEMKEAFTNAYHIKGFILSQMQKFQEALEIYEELIDMNENDPKAYLNVALIYSQMKKDRDSLVAISRAYFLDPKDPHILNALAVILEQCNRNEEAEHIYRELMINDPHNPILTHALSSLLNKMGKTKESDDQIHKAANDTEMMFQLHKMRHQGGHLSEEDQLRYQADMQNVMDLANKNSDSPKGNR